MIIQAFDYHSFSIRVLSIATIAFTSSAFANTAQVCQDITGGIYAESECRAAEIARLKKISNDIDTEIARELKICKPQVSGYNYKKALQTHRAARNHFEQYVKNSCLTVGWTFGQGTGMPAATMTCELELRRGHIQQTQQLLQQVLDARMFLSQQSRGATGGQLAILCNPN